MALRCTEVGGTWGIKRSVQCTEIGIEGFFSSSSCMLQQPNSGLHPFIVEAYGSHIITHTHTHTHTQGRAPLKAWSARRRGRHIHNKRKRRICISSAGFEPATPAIKRLWTYRDGPFTRESAAAAAISTQVFLGFPVPKSKCWDGSQNSKSPLHASHVALST